MKYIKIVSIVLLIIITALLIAVNVFMKPKTAEDVQNEFSNLELSAPEYNSITLSNGKEMGYIIAPNPGKPVFLMLHGSPGSASDFLSYFKDENLRKNYEIVSIDRLGFGKSDHGVETSIIAQANAVNALVQSLELYKKQITTFSHSYGVPIMVYATAQHPEWYHKSLFFGGASSAKDEKVFFFNPWFSFKIIKALLPGPVNNSNDEKLAHAEELDKIAEVYRNYNRSSVFYHGKDDNIVTFANQRWVKEQVTSDNVLFVDVEGKGHVFPMMDKAFTIELIKKHL